MSVQWAVKAIKGVLLQLADSLDSTYRCQTPADFSESPVLGNAEESKYFLSWLDFFPCYSLNIHKKSESLLDSFPRQSSIDSDRIESSKSNSFVAKSGFYLKISRMLPKVLKLIETYLQVE